MKIFKISGFFEFGLNSMKFLKALGKYEGGVEFSAGYRWQHWIRAISIFGLIFTGFYIANPFITYANVSPEPTRFLQAQLREWHIIFGFAMIDPKSVIAPIPRKITGGKMFQKDKP